MTGSLFIDRDVVANRLAAVRRRTLDLVEVLDWAVLRAQHLPILSPMVWDLGHIGHFEELWLGQQLGGLRPLRDGYGAMFDAASNPRPTREALPLPGREELANYLERARRQTLEVLSRDDLDSRLADHGFLFEMVAEHEEQHQETLLQAMQVLTSPPYEPAARRAVPPGSVVDPDEMMPIPAGEILIGLEGDGFAYDNEKQRHPAEVAAFVIDRFPVSNGRYLRFVDDGGYRRRGLWSEEGWAWLVEAGVEAPRNWHRRSGEWHCRFMDLELPLPLQRAVVHVSFHEAEAYARWAGKRLPTETEWEKAALWDPATERPRRYPWGNDPPTAMRANLDQLAFAPAEIGAFRAGASAYGVEQMMGDVWEWTASDFTAYPGFEAFPYDEYSAIFFGSDYKVLRGGSWATRPSVARGTFRNWDYPIRRQIFAGLRCAHDA